VEYSKEDWSVWENDCGKEGEQHSKIEDPKASLYGSEEHFFWCILVFFIVHCLADSYEKEEHDGNDDVQGIELRVEREDAEIIKIPEEMENDHKDDGKSTEHIKFDESFGMSLRSLLSFLVIHAVVLFLTPSFACYTVTC
jgi:hypothetical protein